VELKLETEKSQKMALKLRTSVIKTVTYRILGTLLTVFLALFIGVPLSWSVTLGVGEMIIKPLLYLVHELIWNKLQQKNLE
jgi:uncharacterized membrane protein